MARPSSCSDGWKLFELAGYGRNAEGVFNPRPLKGHLTNQHVGGEQVQALAGVVYDVLNDVGLGIALSKREAEKNLLLGELWENTRAGDVIAKVAL